MYSIIKNDTVSFDCDSSEQFEDEQFANTAQSDQPFSRTQTNIVWTQPVLVTGKAGCSKSYAIYSIVNHCVTNNAKILIVAPTGFLASIFRNNLPHDINSETVNVSFRFPVEDAPPTINWELSKYDLIIIDEISMIPDVIFKHICKTLNLRPVVIICGDAGQQQPFFRQDGKIMPLTSRFDDPSFHSSVYH